MIDTIFCIGKPGSGKSEMVRHLQSFLVNDGYDVRVISDRVGLENAVVEDTLEAPLQPDGSRIGTFSKLIADGEPGHRKIHVLDGSLLNRVHRNMVRESGLSREGSYITLVEYAIGPDVEFGEREPLLQSAQHFVEHLDTHGVVDRSLVIEIEADIATRGQRDALRPDGMAPETFKAFFPDGGEMTTKHQQRLEGHYVYFPNRGVDLGTYRNFCGELYGGVIKPQLPQEARPFRPEGAYNRARVK